jgi:hypothetical protein
MPVAKGAERRSTRTRGTAIRTTRRVTAPKPEEHVPEEEIPQSESQHSNDLGLLMSTTINQRFQESQALARLRSLQQTVLTAAAAGKAEFERKMAAALEDYRIARTNAVRARRRLLAGLTSDETC